MAVRFRGIESAIQSGNIDKISRALTAAKNETHLSAFLQQNDITSKQSILGLMALVLPLASHDDVKLRMQSQTFISYWSSLLSAFSPNLLRSAFSEIDTSALQPPAQAALFTFWAHSLRSVAKSQRQQLVGTCHSLLLGTKAEYLTNVTNDVWELIRETVQTETLKSIIVFLIDSPLAKTVAFLCQKSPQHFFSIVAVRSSLQFIKELIGFWPAEKQIDPNVLKNVLLNHINGTNSSTRSTSLEIMCLLLERYNIKGKPVHPPATDMPFWRETITAVIGIYKESTIAQKSAIIGLLKEACKIKLVSLDDVKQFLNFEASTPSPIIVASIHLSSLFINNGMIPEKLLDFLHLQAIERDPIIYISIFEFLQESFNELYKIVPNSATELLNLCLNPLPRYFVEKVQAIQLLKRIDFKCFPERKLKTSIMEIVLKFIEDPHPSVIAEIPSLLEQVNLQLPLTSLNWFENASSYLPLISSIDPSFVVEMIDTGLLPPASYEISIDMILQQVRRMKTLRNAEAIFSRVMSVLIAGLKALDLPFDKCLLATQSADWNHISSALPELLDVVSGPLLSSTFGKIMNSSILIIASIVSQCRIDSNVVIGLLEVCVALSQAFTSAVCSLVVSLKEMSDILFPKAKERIQETVDLFFQQQFPFDVAEPVALACLQLGVQSSICGPYIYTSAETSRKVLLFLAKENDDLPLSSAFLVAKKREEYMKLCAGEIPFDDWVYEEDEDEAILDVFSEVNVIDFSALPNYKKKAVLDHKKVFKFQTEDITKDEMNEDTISIEQVEERKQVFLETPITEKQKQRKDQSVPKWYQQPEDAAVDCKEEEEKAEEVYEHVNVLPDSIYPHREQTVADLLGFLWFSFRKLSIDEWKTVEHFVLKAVDDDRLLSACLAYATRHSLPINKDKWCNKLQLERRHFKLLAATILLSLIELPLTPIQATFIEDVMIELGYINATEENVMQSLRQETGLALLAVQKIASLIGCVQQISTKEDVINQIDLILDAPIEESARTLSLLFEELPPSFIDRFELPPGIEALRLAVPVAIEVCNPQRSQIEASIIEKLLNYCYQCTDLNKLLFIINALRHCDLNEAQETKFEEIAENIGFSHPLSHLSLLRILPTLTIYKRKSLGYAGSFNTLLERAHLMTSSFTRCLCQCYLSRGLDINDDAKKLFKELPKVFFEFLPYNYELVDFKLVDQKLLISQESCLYLHPVTKQTLALARKTMSSCESAAPRLTRQLLNVDNLKSLFNTVNDETAVIEVSQQLLNLASSDFRFVHSVIDVMNILIDYTPVDGLVMMSLSGTFSGGRNFPSILIALDMIGKQIKKHPEAVAMSDEALNNMMAGLFTNEERLKLFNDEDRAHALSVALKGGSI